MDWTENQQKIINPNINGKFVVKAGPGCGKTACISERIYNLIKKWEYVNSGIAVLSFTNVAKDEIIEKIDERNEKIKLSYPHYIGTFDSFINKYIFLPYSHLTMNCNIKPQLVGKPFNHWYGKDDDEKYFDKIYREINGDINEDFDYYPKSKSKLNKIIKAKHKLNKQGYATLNDSNYFSMKLLQKYPKVAESIACRFPHMIVDEAQDTNELHMEIINLLIKNGLNNIILVGDPEQGIYEWNKTNPHLLNNKFIEWEDSIELDVNFRSSQKICNFYSKLSSLPKIESKVNFEKNYEPQIIAHTNNFQKIIDDFIKDCKNENINITKETVAVLFRSQYEVQKINYNYKKFLIKDIFRGSDYYKISYTRNIIFGKYLQYKKNYLLSFKEFEKAYIKLKYGSNVNINKCIKKEQTRFGFIGYRDKIQDFINSFPPMENNELINEWIKKTNSEKDFELNLISLKKNNIKLYERLTLDCLYEEDYYEETESKYYIGTIHSVKGKSFDAVLLILKHSGYKDKHYTTHFKENTTLMENEELRILYVGMTRPRKILHIAVPKDEYNRWENKFKNKQTTLLNY